jgi:hypothetical protein
MHEVPGMMWERDRSEAAWRAENALRAILPVFLTLGGLWLVWRVNQAQQLRQRERRYRAALSGPAETLPHFSPDEELVEAASADSFPASDPPAYTAGDRMGPPRRH